MLDLREVGAVLGSAEQTEAPMEQRPKTKSRFWSKKNSRGWILTKSKALNSNFWVSKTDSKGISEGIFLMSKWKF